MSKVAVAPEACAAANDSLLASERREWHRARLLEQPLTWLAPDEVEMHFRLMPDRYWERVTAADLKWGLETVHGFLKLVAAPHQPATAPYIEWRADLEPNRTRVMLCTWDRHGLLAKASAAFSAVRLNIVQAEVHTRADHIVLDTFQVEEPDGRREIPAERLQEMSFLLEGALSEPPRFASVWACSRHKFLQGPTRLRPQVTFDNESLPRSTLIRVVAPDRLGLLFDLLQALADEGVAIAQADIETKSGLAQDVLEATEAGGAKIADARRQVELAARITAALTVPE